MRRILMLMVVVMMILINRVEAVELSGADERLICVLSSMASYEDSNGIFVRDVLKRYKWNVEKIIDENKVVNEKILLITRRFDDGSLIKILSVCGTKDIKDAEVDFRLKSVSFGKDNILVHQGFNDYAENVLSKDFDDKLIAELRSNPTEKLYLTGHSLGGAVAILIATKLQDMGVNPKQLKVITFGSPAVGNRNFADKYQDKINLTRVSVNNDPVKKSLQVLGYVHFGNALKYTPAKTAEGKFPHKMIVYLDCALREYYDNFKLLNKNQSKKFYFAPVQLLKDSFSDEDLKFIKSAMEDQIQTEVTFNELKEFDELNNFNDTEVFNQATQAKCQTVIVYYLQCKKIKDDRDGNYRITLEEVKYDLTGFPQAMQTSSITTKELTTLEAVLFTHLNLMRN